MVTKGNCNNFRRRIKIELCLDMNNEKIIDKQGAVISYLSSFTSPNLALGEITTNREKKNNRI